MVCFMSPPKKPGHRGLDWRQGWAWPSARRGGLAGGDRASAEWMIAGKSVVHPCKLEGGVGIIGNNDG